MAALRRQIWHHHVALCARSRRWLILRKADSQHSSSGWLANPDIPGNWFIMMLAAHIKPSDRSARCAVYPSVRSEEHTSELQSLRHILCRLLLEKKDPNGQVDGSAACTLVVSHPRRPHQDA